MIFSFVSPSNFIFKSLVDLSLSYTLYLSYLLAASFCSFKYVFQLQFFTFLPYEFLLVSIFLLLNFLLTRLLSLPFWEVFFGIRASPFWVFSYQHVAFLSSCFKHLSHFSTTESLQYLEISFILLSTLVALTSFTFSLLI